MRSEHVHTKPIETKPSEVLSRLEKFSRQNKTPEYVRRLGQILDEDQFPVQFVIERVYKGSFEIPDELKFSEVVSFDQDAIVLFNEAKLDINQIDSWRLLISCLASLLVRKGALPSPYDRGLLELAKQIRAENPTANYVALAKFVSQLADREIIKLSRMTDEILVKLPSGREASVSEAREFYNELSNRKKIQYLNSENPAARLISEGLARVSALGDAKGENVDDALEMVPALRNYFKDNKLI